MILIRALAGVLSGACALWWARAMAERRQLRRVLVATVGSAALVSDDHLRRLHHELHAHIDPAPIDRSARRPVLRARAVDTWRSGTGLCGENARVAINLLRIGGVRANRLYLEGERWQHCMVEALWHGAWVAFDGHEDKDLRMGEEQIGRIPADRLDLLPNTATRNRWERAVRFKPLLRIRPSRLDGVRPPRVLARVAESPDLIRAMAAGAAAITAWTLGSGR